MAALIEWFSECDACTLAHRAKKGWVPDFRKVTPKNENNRTGNGGLSLLKKNPHPVVRCVAAGATVAEEIQKTRMNSAHIVPYFLPGEASRLNTFWLGLLDQDDLPRFNIGNIKTPEEFSSDNTQPPEDQIYTTLREQTIASEVSDPLLKRSFAKFAKMLDKNEDQRIHPSNFCDMSEKGAGLIVAYCLHRQNNVIWSEEIRKSLLANHPTTFLKEGAPMFIAAAFDPSILETYCEEVGNDWDGSLTKARQKVTALLEQSIENFGNKKIPEGVKMIAKCFAKKRIKGLSKLLK